MVQTMLRHQCAVAATTTVEAAVKLNIRPCGIGRTCITRSRRSFRRHASSNPPSPSLPIKKLAAKPLAFQSADKTSSRRVIKTSGQAADHSSTEKQPLSELFRHRWLGIFGCGAAALCIGAFTANLVMHIQDEAAPCYPLGCEPEIPTGRPSIQSPVEFDTHLDKSEWRLGITKLRRQVTTMAQGHVLEVAIGTGRNIEFYDWATVDQSLKQAREVEKEATTASSWSFWKGKAKSPSQDAVLSFTGLDVSPGMLDITLLRMRQLIPHMVEHIPKKPSFAQLFATRQATVADHDKQGPTFVSFASDQIRLLRADAQASPIPPPPLTTPRSTVPPKYYDTIIQTFGLCSVRDPVSLIANMAAVTKPGNGRILLLEHGRSWWDVVNGLLDRSARGHFERFGCWWNRDVEAIVRTAERTVPGLEVLRVDRPGWATMGTHIVVEMRVRDKNPETAHAARETRENQKLGVPAQAKVHARGDEDTQSFWERFRPRRF